MSNEQGNNRFRDPNGWREICPRDRAAFQHDLAQWLLFEEREAAPLIRPDTAPAYLRRRVVASAPVIHLAVRMRRLARDRYLVHARVRSAGREFKTRFEMQDGLIGEKLHPLNADRHWLHNMVSLAEIYSRAVPLVSRKDLEEREGFKTAFRNYQTRHYNTVRHEDSAHHSIQYLVQCEAHKRVTRGSNLRAAYDIARAGRFCPACRNMPPVDPDYEAHS